MKILNLGSGTNPIENAINLDIREFPKTDILWDLNEFPYPFQNNYFDIVYLHDILEHLKEPKEVMYECWRITKPGGYIEIIIVHWSHHLAYSDIQHKHTFAEQWFKMYTLEGGKQYPTFRFERMEVDYIFDKEACKKFLGKENHLSDIEKDTLLKMSRYQINILQGLKIKLYKHKKKENDGSKNI